MDDDVMAVLLPMLRNFEGLVLEAAPVGAGCWEVGYGHRCAGPMSITRDDAERMLIDDVRIALHAVDVAVTAPTSVGQCAALASLAYNIGGGALRRSTLVRKFNAGDVAGAADEFKRFVFAGGRVLPGLVRRREAERTLFLSDAGRVSADNAAVDWPERVERPASVEPASEKAGKGSGVLSWLVERVKEPSTWRGLGGLLATAGVVSGGTVDAVIAVGMALVSAVEIFRRERAA